MWFSLFYKATPEGPALPPLRRGFPFALFRALMPPMAPDLENVISQALADATTAGCDHLGQTRLAVRAVMQVRPDMTASDALTAVNLVRRS